MAASRRRRSVQGEWEHTMEITELGSTGLKVSVAGLGCGGNSRVGLGRGASIDECVDIVRTAIDLGVNFLDTAENYGTEEIVGEAAKKYQREDLVISTKAIFRGDMANPAVVTEILKQITATVGIDVVSIPTQSHKQQSEVL